MSVEIVRAARAIAGGIERRDFAFTLEDGRIGATGPFDRLSRTYPQAATRSYGADAVVTPGFINGHSHAYQILLRGWADDLTFAAWRSEALYKVVPQLTPDDISRVFASAFREMLAGGITTVAEFFYLNGAGNEHAARAIEAARDCGIRLVFARTWMDADYAPAAFREDAGTARSRTLELIQAYPQTHICVAPHSLHAASPEMIRAAAAFARERDCMMHVHAAEAPYEGEQTRERFGHTPIALLDELGALDERTVAIHAIYIDEREKQLLAQRGARVIHNPMTNQYLGDGICDVVGLRAHDVTMGLGTDADVKPSIFEEMRAASLLQKIARLDGGALGAAAAFDLATAQGARALRVDAGDLRAGAHADYIVIEAAGIDEWSPALNAIVYRGENSWVRETVVAGRTVYKK